MTVTKAELSQGLADTLHFSKRDSMELVDALFEIIRERLEQGQALKISGLGNFSTRSKPERPGRNPKTGDEVAVSSRRVVSFKPGQKLKARVEEAHHGRGGEALSVESPDDLE